MSPGKRISSNSANHPRGGGAKGIGPALSPNVGKIAGKKVRASSSLV